MKFNSPLKSATLLKRYKRFLADVELEDGSVTTVYCSNTGKMTGCATPNDKVWLLANANPKRKYKLSWELTQTQANHLICVNTARANQLVEEAIHSGVITELQGYNTVQREVKYGEENSRIDFLLTSENKPHCYVEVKSCTLLEDGHGYFPDTVTTRGQKHLRELIQMKRLGFRSVLLFTALHSGINTVQAAAHIDKKYAELFNLAIKEGVEVLSYSADISTDGLTLTNKLPASV